jgi:BirA family transcriptional regulator, biotin operon repressor / biotin---[acetyl-CoA-carboxylase] ligase
LYKIPASTLFMGKNLVFVPECHSTNDLALLLCQQSGAAEGTLVITHHQTRGRGQRGNSWEAEPGKNLTFSLVLRPSFLAVKDQFLLNVLISLSIVDYLKNFYADSLVKWPNDIIAGNKKICGILIENQVRGTTFDHVVAGIGLNINQQDFSLDTPTSLRLLTGQEHDLQTVLEGVLKNIEARYLQLREGKSAALKEAYIRAMYWFNEKRTFSAGEEIFEGVITAVDESGRLIVNHNNKPRTFALKEISFLR